MKRGCPSSFLEQEGGVLPHLTSCLGEDPNYQDSFSPKPGKCMRKDGGSTLSVSSPHSGVLPGLTCFKDSYQGSPEVHCSCLTSALGPCRHRDRQELPPTYHGGECLSLSSSVPASVTCGAITNCGGCVGVAPGAAMWKPSF